ncbi:MAG: hypothetical protein M9930_15190 [Anaerolineae bacterium]|nr:hypothetical protein [Anaerolineae bacterium]
MMSPAKRFGFILFCVAMIIFAFLLLLPDIEAVHVPAAGQAQAPLAAQQQQPETGADPIIARDVEIPDAGGTLPLMIRWSNWRDEFGPSIVYARESDLNGMLRMSGPVTKMVMVTSYGEAERMMARADELQAAGVTAIGLNTENGQGMTPGNEMQTLNSSDPNVNIVARVARLVTENGFSMLWGPVRRVLDTTSDATIRTMLESGVSGIALQEQKFIETQSAGSRAQAVQQTISRYQSIADQAGSGDLSFHVQIMQQRCPNLSNCVDFVTMLAEMKIDSLAIWSNGPIPPDFVRTVRSE